MGIEQNPELMQNREGWRMMMPRLTKSCKTAEIETVLILPKWDRGEQMVYRLCKYVLRSGQKSFNQICLRIAKSIEL